MSDITHGSRLELPYDLIAHILSHLCSDNHSLRQSAEVSRAWLWPARTHLFHHIHISNGMVWDKLENTLESTPDIGSLVRIFSISDLRYFLFDALYRDKVVCKALTAIEDLRISNIGPAFPLDISSDRLGVTASRLTLARVNLKSTNDFFRVVSVRPRLMHVSLYEIRLRNNSSGAILEALQLQTIVLDGYTVRTVMSSDGVKLKIRPQSLTVQSIADEDIPSLAHLLQQIGENLDYFCIDMHAEAVEAAWAETLSQHPFLSLIPRLRTLVIDNPAWSIFRLAPVLHGILLGVRSPYLETITITIQIRGTVELTMKPSDEVLTDFSSLAELNQLLDEPLFSMLKLFYLQVRFETGQRRQPQKQWYFDTHDEEDLIIGVQKLFPRLHARGILRWTFFFRSEPEWTLKSATR